MDHKIVSYCYWILELDCILALILEYTLISNKDYLHVHAMDSVQCQEYELKNKLNICKPRLMEPHSYYCFVSYGTSCVHFVKSVTFSLMNHTIHDNVLQH